MAKTRITGLKETRKVPVRPSDVFFGDSIQAGDGVLVSGIELQYLVVAIQRRTAAAAGQAVRAEMAVAFFEELGELLPLVYLGPKCVPQRKETGVFRVQS